MGAVITQEGTTDRKKLIDIGAAGPLAGLVVALPVLIYGLQLSPVTAIPATAWSAGGQLDPVPCAEVPGQGGLAARAVATTSCCTPRPTLAGRGCWSR